MLMVDRPVLMPAVSLFFIVGDLHTTPGDFLLIFIHIDNYFKGDKIILCHHCKSMRNKYGKLCQDG